MKSLAGVLILLVLVATVAVTGSQAQPIPRTNPALRICQPTGTVAPEAARCKPVVVLATTGEVERELAGGIGGDTWAEGAGDYSDPEFLVKAAVDLARAFAVAVVVDLAERFMDWAFGDGATGRGYALAPLDTTLFDPQD